jgi:hypothetical protein
MIGDTVFYLKIHRIRVTGRTNIISMFYEELLPKIRIRLLPKPVKSPKPKWWITPAPIFMEGKGAHEYD